MVSENSVGREYQVLQIQGPEIVGIPGAEAS